MPKYSVLHLWNHRNYWHYINVSYFENVVFRCFFCFFLEKSCCSRKTHWFSDDESLSAFLCIKDISYLFVRLILCHVCFWGRLLSFYFAIDFGCTPFLLGSFAIINTFHYLYLYLLLYFYLYFANSYVGFCEQLDLWDEFFSKREYWARVKISVVDRI